MIKENDFTLKIWIFNLEFILTELCGIFYTNYLFTFRSILDASKTNVPGPIASALKTGRRFLLENNLRPNLATSFYRNIKM